MIDQGGSKGQALRFMTEKPSELLTTILVGNNLANILAASMTTTISARYFENDALSISVGVTTFIILVFGEIIPKLLRELTQRHYQLSLLEFFKLITMPFTRLSH